MIYILKSVYYYITKMLNVKLKIRETEMKEDQGDRNESAVILGALQKPQKIFQNQLTNFYRSNIVSTVDVSTP